MALYRYIKAQPAWVLSADKPSPTAKIEISLPKLIPVFMMSVGIILISSVAIPIIYHELVLSPKLRRTAFISPVPGTIEEQELRSQVAGVSTSQPSMTPTPPPPAKVDYTQATNWFPQAPIVRPNPSKITHYTINIPKLNIKNAIVAIGSSDLRKTLVQYGGTANPGEYGTPVIFGHSILRQFYSPAETNPNRYMSIFSTIMTLNKGDEITIDFDGLEYRYKVVDKYAVKPNQVEVLQQRYDRQTIKLITCIPEGTYIERGVIEAQLVTI